MEVGLLGEGPIARVVLEQKIGEPCGSPKDTSCVLEDKLGTELDVATLVVGS